MRTQLFQQYKPMMQTGDLLFFSTDGWVQNIIRYKTKSKYSHVAIVLVLREAPEWVFLVHASKHTHGVVPALASDVIQNLKGIASWAPLNHQKCQQINPTYKRDIAFKALMLIGLDYNMATLWRGYHPFLRSLIPAYYEGFCCSFAAAYCLKSAKIVPTIELTHQQLLELDVVMPPVPLWPAGQFYSEY